MYVTYKSGYIPPAGWVGTIEQAMSVDKRKNNPHVGLVNENTDPGQPQTAWRYDPHIESKYNLK
jgi:hypothetical protein